MFTTLIKRWSFTLLCLVAAGTPSSYAQDHILDRYIQDAFTQNQGLLQQNFQLEKSMYALQEAKSMYYPTVGLTGSYTKADGGRSIDLPLGDLLNSAYSSLNKLTGTTQFPQLKNQTVLFNPDNFYDAHVRTTLPLINTEIWYAKKLRQESITLQQASVNVYKRQLVKDIKTAYYQYYQSCQAISIYQTAMLQVQENIRVNKSFVANGVANTTSLTRAQAEQQRIQSNITQAENQERNAKAYFNFLLNKSLLDSIVIDSSLFVPASLLSDPNTGNTGNREELQELQQQKKIATLQYQRTKSGFTPQLNTFLDLGSQGFNFDVNNKSVYYIWGINLQWDLFTAGKRKHQAAQAAMDIKTISANYDQTDKSLQLELTTAENNYHTALASYANAQTQQQLSEKYYNDQLKVYKAGQLLYIELLDAQNQLTNARLQVSVTYAQVQIALADIERATAAYKL
jgi:outer membrane protein TolC